VSKRDGRLEPFDADKICQSLFAATENLGSPNAFLARELTDAVVHFLAADGVPLTTAGIAEQIVKVVRELGQPAIAAAFDAGANARRQVPAAAPSRAPAQIAFTFSSANGPAEVVRRCMQTYSEHLVFSRDLVSAQHDGLLLLSGLDTPLGLAGCVAEFLQGSSASWRELPALCDIAGQGLVIDGPEWSLPSSGDASLRQLYQERLLQLPLLARRQVVVNANTAQPPAWARQRGGGPLFAEQPADELALAPLLEAMSNAATLLRWDWHLQARDFNNPAYLARLRHVARLVLDGVPIAFVFDRQRRPVALAEGMDRRWPAVLMEVGVDLATFLRLPAIGGRAQEFRDKLASLASMAVSAGAQKRKYLRRHADGTGLGRAFLLDRARLVVVPLGLDRVVRSLTGQAATTSPLSLDLARQAIATLREHLQLAGQAVHLEVSLDSPGPGLNGRVPALSSGLSCADEAADAERQLIAASALHAVAGQGTALVLWPDDAEPTVNRLVDLLQFAWRRTELVRVRFVRKPAALAQAELDL
jgi:hypothetical protein